MSHKILMFGWEFPPHNSGGLGVACQGIARALVRSGHDLHFVCDSAGACSSSTAGTFAVDSTGVGGAATTSSRIRGGSTIRGGSVIR